VLLQRLGCPLRQFEDTPALAGLSVALGPHRSVDGNGARVQVDLGPGERAGFLGANAREQGHDYVGGEPVRAAWSGLAQNANRLVQGHGPGRAAFLTLGQDDQAGDVAPYLVAGLGVPDRALQDLLHEP
jgi:hypothetical protein